MEQATNSVDLGALSNSALTTQLEQFEGLERLVSKQRGLLHDYLDATAQANGNGISAAAEGLLVAIQEEERSLSERRLQLHQQINGLRIERSKRLTALREPLAASE